MTALSSIFEPSVPNRAIRILGLLPLPIVLACQFCGCARPRISEFQIINHDRNGQRQRYRATFDEAYYGIDSQGNLEVVLRSTEPSEREPTVNIVQVLHLRTVWHSIPGRTVAETTQINATVSYHILRGRDGTTFEGAGSLFFKQNRDRDRLEGSLDLANVKPTGASPGGSELFLQAELSGEFLARRNPRRVARIANDMERLFRTIANR